MLKLTTNFKSAMVCGLLFFMTSSAQAALIEYSFTGTLDSGLLSGESFNGQFTFDDSGFANSGLQGLSLSSFALNFHNTSFNAGNADTTPTVDYQDGTFLGLSYTNSLFDPGFSLVSGFTNSSEAYFAYTPTNGNAGFGSLSFTNLTAVPLPAAIWLFGSALAGFGAINRRKRQHTI
jgi:hypothetical protein